MKLNPADHTAQPQQSRHCHVLVIGGLLKKFGLALLKIPQEISVSFHPENMKCEKQTIWGEPSSHYWLLRSEKLSWTNCTLASVQHSNSYISILALTDDTGYFFGSVPKTQHPMAFAIPFKLIVFFRLSPSSLFRIQVRKSCWFYWHVFPILILVQFVSLHSSSI